uniref:Heterokaryon incompatibility domain-containing protein n=1 Tax=Bionectria ochroleuca TaxID=29856 RepID=A0A0B7KN93_BIOOC
MFVYDSLDSLGGAANAIRLLTILPSSVGGPIECRLDSHRVSVDERPRACGGVDIFELSRTICRLPRYEALSYVWGSIHETADIAINDQPHRVTKRLETALRDLRNQDEERTMWIDALCIDQENAPEKSVQILRMNRIYEAAHRVIAWLGPSSPVGDLAVEIVKQVGGSDDVLTEGIDDGVNPIRMVPKVLDDAPSLSSIVFENGDRWAALRWVFENPWWKRAWIIQEGTHADDLRFQVGRETFGVDSLTNIISSRDYRVADYGELDMQALCQPLTALMHERSLRRDDDFHAGFRQSASLMNLLSRFDYSESSDPRDKIYALLNLCDLDQLDITPDYSRSVQQVYQDTAMAIIRKEKSLNILNDVRRSMKASSVSASLPSWVPDFSVPAAISPVVLLSSRRAGSFRAAGDTEADYTYADENGGPLGQLQVSGYNFDLITETFACPPEESFQDDSWASIVREWALTARHGAYPTGGSYEDAICRTLLQDRIRSAKERITDDDFARLKKSFSAWVFNENMNVPALKEERKAKGSSHDHAEEPQTLEERWKRSVYSSITADKDSSEFKKFLIQKWEREDTRRQERAELAERFLERSFLDHAKPRLMGWKMAYSEKGYVALVPFDAQVGDMLVVFAGLSVPVVVRRLEPGEDKFLSTCYVHGIMDADARVIEGLEEKNEIFALV